MREAIVTGASGGIGKAVVAGLEQCGYIVHQVNRSICDVTNKGAIDHFVSGVSRVDLLVNCAGLSHLGEIESITEEELQTRYDVNVLGTVRFCKAVLPLMKEQQEGYIINIGSLRGVECCPGKAA